MSDLILEILKNIQARLSGIEDQMADLRDQMMVQTAIMQRMDATIDSLKVEVRAIGSRFDRHERRLAKLEADA
jgi:archaellum component FlaC